MTDLAASRRAAAIRVYEAAELALRGLDRDGAEGNRWANIASEARAIADGVDSIEGIDLFEHAQAGALGPRGVVVKLRG